MLTPAVPVAGSVALRYGPSHALGEIGRQERVEVETVGLAVGISVEVGTRAGGEVVREEVVEVQRVDRTVKVVVRGALIARDVGLALIERAAQVAIVDARVADRPQEMPPELDAGIVGAEPC